MSHPKTELESLLLLEHVHSYDFWASDGYQIRVRRSGPECEWELFRYEASKDFDKGEGLGELIEWWERSQILCEDEKRGGHVWAPWLKNGRLPNGFEPYHSEDRSACTLAMVLGEGLTLPAGFVFHDRDEDWWQEHCPGFHAELTGEGSECEGCFALATMTDSECVHLCDSCGGAE